MLEASVCHLTPRGRRRLALEGPRGRRRRIVAVLPQPLQLAVVVGHDVDVTAQVALDIGQALA
jgi:hypothetical protein